jgi:hypothetical protein
LPRSSNITRSPLSLPQIASPRTHAQGTPASSAGSHHFDGDLRLSGERDFIGNTGRLTAFDVSGPLLGKFRLIFNS